MPLLSGPALAVYVTVRFELWQWALIVLGGLGVGLSKCGLTGLGVLTVALFQNAMPAKTATGFMLPLLIAGDVCAVTLFRRHAQWGQLWRLFPWTVVGVAGGYFAMAAMSDYQARVLITSILAAFLLYHWTKRRPGGKVVDATALPGRFFAPTSGSLAGFTTTVANAAGPIMALYLLAMRLPKMAFVGTGAYFFLLLNVFKVPFLADLDLVTRESLTLNAALAPTVLLGGGVGYWMMRRINQAWFERLVFWLTVASVGRMAYLLF